MAAAVEWVKPPLGKGYTDPRRDAGREAMVHRSTQQILAILAVAALVASPFLQPGSVAIGSAQAAAGSNIVLGAQLSTASLSTHRSVSPASVISVTDADWRGSSLTDDCATGWAVDTWELTLTKAQVVTFSLEDCCTVGDYYELWIDGTLRGTTPHVSLYGPTASAGTFAVRLAGGTHQIQVRDAAFQTFSSDVLGAMCPAGFFLAWSLGDTASSWWTGVLHILEAVGKRIGLAAGELIARIQGWGPAWEGLVAGWQMYTAGELYEQFDTPDYRARLIDECYNSSDCGDGFRARVDSGVAGGCALIGCTATTWNELTDEQQRTDAIWLSVCASVGGGFCSGYLLPPFMSKWLEEAP